MSSTYSCQTISGTGTAFFNWTCGKLSHIFCSANFNSETVLDFSSDKVVSQQLRASLTFEVTAHVGDVDHRTLSVYGTKFEVSRHSRSEDTADLLLRI